jgi:hypothetical protein
MNDETTTVTTQFSKVAISELLAIANECRASFAKERLIRDERFKYWTKGGWQVRTLLEPDRFNVNSSWCPPDGVFAGLQLDRILALCFTPEAIRFLLDHAYNGYLFWDNVRHILVLEGKIELPYSLEIVQKLVVEDYTPFGHRKCSYSEQGMAALASAVNGSPESFDPGNLEAVYACKLLDCGFLLLADDTLVVNPMWLPLLNQVVSVPTPAEKK